MSAKKAILKTLIENQIVELMVKSQVDNIYLTDGETTLASKLAEMITAINSKATPADIEAAVDGLAVASEVTEEINTAVSTAIDNLINGAPETYDTLKEIADYLTQHGNEYTALVQTVAGKVDKVEGKGLSTEDFTTALKTKLESLENYVAPVGSKSAKGEVQVGSNIDVTEDGVISVADASVTAKGVVQLSDSTNSDVSDMAATSKAVKTVNDAVSAEVTRATGVEEGLQTAIDAINNADTGILKTAKDYTDTEVTKAKNELSGQISGAFHFKGVVDTIEDLEAIENPAEGDVYQVTQPSARAIAQTAELYAFNGTEWVKLDSIVDLSAYATTEEVTSAIATAKSEAIAETTALANGAVATNAANISTLEGKVAAMPNVIVAASQPDNLKAGDIWAQIID